MTINMMMPEGRRITDLNVRCSQGCTDKIDISGNSYEAIVANKDYPVVGTTYLFNEGDGYKALNQSYKHKIQGKIES